MREWSARTTVSEGAANDVRHWYGIDHAPVSFSPAQRRDVTLLALLRGVSLLGDALAMITLYLRLAPSGHAWAIAALSIAGTLPLMVLSPLAGYVIDRVAAKRFLAMTGLVEAVVCLGLGYWHGLGATLVLMLALASAVAFSFPGYSALVPVLAGEENVASSQGILQAVQGGASVLGPTLGGVLVGTVGQSWPLYLDAISYFLAAMATLGLRHDRRPSPRLDIERAEAGGMMAGVTLLWRDGLLRPTVVVTFIFLLAVNLINVGEVFFITVTLHGSAVAYGLLAASFGLGSVIGSLAARRFSQELVRLARSILVNITVVGLMFTVVGLATRVAFVYPFMAVAGVSAGVANVAFFTLTTLRSPEALRGRVFAAVNAVFTAGQIGATAGAGVVLAFVTPRTLYQIGGVAATVCAVVLGPVALRASRAAHQREAD